MEIPGFQTQGSGGSEETHMPGSVQECYHLFFNYMKTQNPDDLAKFNSAAEALREKMPANSEAQKIFDKCLENTGCSTFCPTENFPSDTGAL
ncbi:MAG: hypothetical protein MRY21_00610, partial [Simkaniaceae bacterium]|nr:hypothetical protein [Simkaniaceae bacterium]